MQSCNKQCKRNQNQGAKLTTRSRYDIKINIEVTFNKAQFTHNEFEEKQSENFLSTENSSGL